LRPGEKLYEELSTEGENIAPTLHPKIMRFVSELPNLADMLAVLEGLSAHLHTGSVNQLKLELQRAIPEYRPYLIPARELLRVRARVERQ
jgi:FlaA1/EpsC-like NDP-sugar epimerase